MADAKAHADRVKQELREAGVSRLGLMKFGIRYLPKIIHPDEHIKGVVYGRYRIEERSSSWEEGTLIATDKRVIFLDHKPGYTKTDELPYDVVDGVESSRAWRYSAVRLSTKMHDFDIRFANPKCVEKFVQYVEARRLESLEASDL